MRMFSLKKRRVEAGCVCNSFGLPRGCFPVIKNTPANTGDIRDMGLIPGLERSPGGEHGNPLQYSCLENPHGQRSLAGYSPWDPKESDTTEVT